MRVLATVPTPFQIYYAHSVSLIHQASGLVEGGKEVGFSLWNPHCWLRLLMSFLSCHKPFFLTVCQESCPGSTAQARVVCRTGILSSFLFFFLIFLKVGTLFPSSPVLWQQFCFSISIYKEGNSGTITFCVQVTYTLPFGWLVSFLLIL